MLKMSRRGDGDAAMREPNELDAFRRAILKKVGAGELQAPVVNDLGERHVVVAMPDEPIPSLLRRVRLAGGYANVFVKRPEGGLYSVSVLKPEGTLVENVATPVSIPSDAETSVGMFIDYLLKRRSGIKLAMVEGWPEPQTGIKVETMGSEQVAC